jgi:transcriptional regulator with XRE-family HTH domain
MAETAASGRRDRWPVPIRDAALRLRREHGLSASRIAQILAEDHDVVVPLPTVKGWLGRPRDDGQSVHQIARRALGLAEREIDALERSSKPLDVDRLAKLAAALKTLQPLLRDQPKAARTLADLASDPEESSEAEGETGLEGLI